MSSDSEDFACPHCQKLASQHDLTAAQVCEREVRKMFIKLAFTGTGPNEMFRAGGISGSQNG